MEGPSSIAYIVKPEFRRTGWREFLLPYGPYKAKIDNKELVAEINAFPPIAILGALGYVLYEVVTSLYGWLF